MFRRYYFGVLVFSIALNSMFTSDANAIYSPQTGRFLNRDPIGYAGGMSLYQYCTSGPISKMDPLGLEDQVVGIDNGPPRKVIRLKFDMLKGDSCYILVNGRQTTVPCPIAPPNDPDGPGYQQGIDSFVFAGGLMKDMCGKCCKKCNCEKDVNRFIAELIYQWQSNYRDSTGCPEQQVGGNWCYTWAWFFKNGIDSLPNMGCGFKSTVRRAWGREDPPGSNFWLVHYWVQVTMGDGGPGCSIWFDDGFTEGLSNYHPGIYPDGWDDHYPNIDEDLNPPPPVR